VRKLRTKEAGAGVGGLGKSESTLGVDARSVDGFGERDGRDADVRSTHTAQSGHSYPPPAVLDPNMRTGASAEWERTLWKKLEVGDLVLLRDDEQVCVVFFFTLSSHLPSIFAFVFVMLYGTNDTHARRSQQTSSSSPRPTRTGTAISRRRIWMGRRI
jgi:hypothetical protein